MRRYAAGLLIAILLTFAGRAYAASGTAYGYLKFWQKQGNYCPTTRDCTSAWYPESQYDTAQPAAETKLYLYAGYPFTCWKMLDRWRAEILMAGWSPWIPATAASPSWSPSSPPRWA